MHFGQRCGFSQRWSMCSGHVHAHFASTISLPVYPIEFNAFCAASPLSSPSTFGNGAETNEWCSASSLRSRSACAGSAA